MKLLFSFTLMMSVFFARAQNPLTTEGSLSAVTVFRFGAELHHKAKINLPSGSSEIVINNVAGMVDEKTIQVGATANLTIMSVAFNKNYLKPLVKTPEYFTIEDSLVRINKKLRHISDERATEESVLKLLDKNSLAVGANTSLSVLELTRLTTYYKSKQLETKNNLATLTDQEDVLNEQKEKLANQLAEFGGNRSSTMGQIVLQVVARNAANTDLTVSYISPNAGWSAFYDLRADKTSDPLKLAYKANIVQNTGIDWEKVKLTLSTGNPTVSGIAPTLSTWQLRFNSNYISESMIAQRPVNDIVSALEGNAAGVNIPSGGGQPGTVDEIMIRGQNSLSTSSAPLIVVDGALYNGNLTSINPDDVASMNVLKDASATAIYGSRGTNGVIMITTRNKTASHYTTASENNLNTTFDIDIPYDIASNNKPHSVALHDYALPVHYKYFAIPRLDPDAFLMADVTDYEKLSLLPGLANIIFENMYIGKSYINPGITTDTLTLSMGRDRKITIKREKVTDLSGTKLLSNNRKQTFTYEIQVRNGKQEAIDISLKDQFPVAADKAIEVELLQSDNAKVDQETGFLSWELNIPPGQTKKIRISYSVKYPVGKTITNL
jgi:TonB-dependent SusC/RagA subfamily outer membrane receptor